MGGSLFLSRLDPPPLIRISSISPPSDQVRRLQSKLCTAMVCHPGKEVATCWLLFCVKGRDGVIVIEARTVGSAHQSFL